MMPVGRGGSTGLACLYAITVAILVCLLLPWVDRAATRERRNRSDYEAVVDAVLFARRTAEARRSRTVGRSRGMLGEEGTGGVQASSGRSCAAERGSRGAPLPGTPEDMGRARGPVLDGTETGRSPPSDQGDEAEAVRRTMIDALGRGCALVTALAGGAAMVLGAALRASMRRLVDAAEAAGAVRDRPTAGGGVRGDEMRRLQEAIRGFPMRLEAMRTELRRTMAGMAHDLRSPAMRLRLSVQAARSAVPPDDAVAEELDRALRRCDDLSGLMGALLLISEIERDEASRPVAPVDLVDLGQMLFEDYEPAVADGGRSLSLVAEGEAWALANRPLVMQAVANLLDNANIHTPVGTGIAIAVEAAADGVRLSVCDDGPGVAERDRRRLAEPFFRSGEGCRVAGHGLGLNMVETAMRAMGGRFLVEAGEGGRGLRVTLVLPGVQPPERTGVSSAPVEPDAAASHAPHGGGGSARGGPTGARSPVKWAIPAVIGTFGDRCSSASRACWRRTAAMPSST